MTHPENAAIGRAKHIIEVCGGVDAVARATGRSKGRIYSWTYRKNNHGTGGVIPAVCQLQIMEFARREGIDLSPSDFFPPDVAGECRVGNEAA